MTAACWITSKLATLQSTPSRYRYDRSLPRL
jgi:hypothetical protein